MPQILFIGEQKKITSVRVKSGMSLADTIDEMRTTLHQGGEKKAPQGLSQSEATHGAEKPCMT
jgi:hypothetical protein